MAHRRPVRRVGPPPRRDAGRPGSRIGRTGAALLLAFFATAGTGCPTDPVKGDTGFHVTGSVPSDDDMEVVESIHPELRFNATPSEASCNEETLLLARSNRDWVITGTVPYALTWIDGGRKVQFEPDEVLPNGSWYTLTVRSGNGGCTDVDGRTILPFAVQFFVP